MKALLSPALAAQIEQQAREAFPLECCGLIEGERIDDGFRILALHPARNLASTPGCFEINPADHVTAQKAARGRGHVLVGCYHSHPDGAPQPSHRDLAGAGEENFLWLIAAIDGAQCRLAAFVYRSASFEGIALSDAVGADWVTSSL